MSKSENTYEVTLKNIRGEEINDVTMCTCIRAPFYKKASFWMIKVNMSTLLAQQILNEITLKTLKPLTLFIHEVKINDKNNEIIRLNLVHERQYKCIHAITSSNGYKPDIEDANTEMILTLSDFILFDLFTKQSFNRKFSDMTAFDILVNEYETKFLKEKYGDQTFKFNHIGVDEDRNVTKHKELLLAAKNDLDVGDLLLYNKKAMNAPSLYFFDDFYLSEQLDSAITCHFINLNNLKALEKFDISKWYDIKYATTLIKEIPINDSFYKLIQGEDSIVIRKNNMTSDVSKTSKKTFYPSVNNVSEHSYIVSDNRLSNLVSVDYDNLKHENSGNNSDYEKRQKHLVIYSQDSDDDTKQRLKNYRIFIEARAKQFVISQTQDCFCDWMQFGRSYNFDITDEKRDHHLFTPIAIENVFYKDENNNSVKQITRALLLEYYDNEDKSCSSCKYYDSTGKYCKVHIIAKEPESWCYDFEDGSSST